MIQNYLGRLLFLAILLASDISFGQQIKPFEDYSQCKAGFVNEFKPSDTLFPAKFENVQGIQSSSGFYSQKATSWILSEEGKFGCLSSRGTWIIPCQFESLKHFQKLDVFIAKLNGKVGVLSMKNEIIVPFEYDQIIEKNELTSDKTILVKKQGYGLFDISGTQLIPPIFDSISSMKYKDGNRNYSGEYLLVRSNGKFGLSSLQRGELTPVSYNDIEFLISSSPSHEQHFFRVTNDKGEQTVLDRDGKELFPFVRAELYPTLHDMRSWEEVVEFVVAKDSAGNKKLISLTTGKSSRTFKYVVRFDRFIQFYEHDKYTWELLDHDFNSLYSDSNEYDLCCFPGYYNSCFPWPSSKEHTILMLSSIDSLTEQECLECKKQSKFATSKKRYAEDCRYAYHFGLLDLDTRKKTETKYGEVRVMRYDNEHYFWAFYDYEGDNRTTRKLDIYDAKGKKKKTLVLSNTVNYCSEGDSRWLYVKENNKYRLYDIAGNLVSDSLFDKQPEFVYQDKKNEIIAQRYEENGTEFVRFYDFNKKPILNGNIYRDYEIERNDQRYALGILLALNDGKYSIATENLNILLDSCSTLVSTFDPQICKSRYDKYFLTLKGDNAYVIHNMQVALLDSTIFGNRTEHYELYYEGTRFLVSKTGKIVPKAKPVEEPTDFGMGDIFLNVRYDTLTVKDRKHQTVQIVNNYKEYYRDGNRYTRGVWIRFWNNRTGFLSLHTGQWLLKPNYRALNPYQIGREDKFWVLDPAIDSLHWSLVNPEGRQLTSLLFDSPVVFAKNDFVAPFYVNGLVGIIDSNMHVCTEPKFRYFLHTQYGEAFLFKDSLAFIVDHTTGKCFPISGQFLNRPFPLGHILYRNDSIRLLKSDGSPVTQFIPIKYAVEKLDLVNMLIGDIHKEGKSFPYYVIDELITNEMNNPALRKLNNRLLLENALSYKTRVETLNTSYDHCSIRPIWISKGYYSEELKGDRYKHSDRKELRQTLSYRNYLIGKDSLQLLTLSDLFKPNSNYAQLLDSLIEDEIQKNQVFGTVCADMPRAVYEFKQNFYIYGTKIHFLHYPGMREIYLELYQFRELLLHPEYFSLEQK